MKLSLTAWRTHTLKGAAGDFVLVKATADWFREDHSEMLGLTMPGWFAVTLGLFGFCACVTYWPKGKA